MSAPQAAKGARGERVVRIGALSLTMVPEFERFDAIETALGKGVLELMDRGNVAMGSVVEILFYGSREDVTRQQLADALIGAGGVSAVAREIDFYLGIAAFGLARVNEWMMRLEAARGAKGDQEAPAPDGDVPKSIADALAVG